MGRNVAFTLSFLPDFGAFTVKVARSPLPPVSTLVLVDPPITFSTTVPVIGTPALRPATLTFTFTFAPGSADAGAVTVRRVGAFVTTYVAVTVPDSSTSSLPRYFAPRV